MAMICLKHSLFLEIGNPLQIEIEGFLTRFATSLVGVVGDEHLIIESPALPIYVGAPKHFAVGSEIVVRCLSQGQAWGFRSTLERVISTPARLLVIEFPKQVENFSLRKHKRIPCLLPGTIKVRKSQRKGLLQDISENGCFFSVKMADGKNLTDMGVEDEATILCQLPGMEGEQTLKGCIRHLHQDAERTAFGIEFDEIDSKILKRISQYAASVTEETS